MKNTLRAALVVLVLAGMYAGVRTPSPAKTHSSVTMAEGTDPTPTTLPSAPAPRPSNPKTT